MKLGKIVVNCCRYVLSLPLLAISSCFKKIWKRMGRQQILAGNGRKNPSPPEYEEGQTPFDLLVFNHQMISRNSDKTTLQSQSREKDTSQDRESKSNSESVSETGRIPESKSDPDLREPDLSDLDLREPERIQQHVDKTLFQSDTTSSASGSSRRLSRSLLVAQHQLEHHGHLIETSGDTLKTLSDSDSGPSSPGSSPISPAPPLTLGGTNYRKKVKSNGHKIGGSPSLGSSLVKPILQRKLSSPT